MENAVSKEKLGVFSLVFFVVAAASPLTGFVGALPIIMLSGNGAGIPGAYALAGMILLLFSVGFMTMSRYVKNSGAFYAYISAGLGKYLGISSLGLAVLTYVSVYLAVAAMFGLFVQLFVHDYLGVSLPWWIYTFGLLLAVCWLGAARIEIGSKVLGVLMLLEVAISLLISGSVIVHTVSDGSLDFMSFAPSTIFQGNVGIALVLAMAGFIGFEATAIYTDECREPEKTVPRATLIAVLLITLFFMVCSWGVIQAFGSEGVLAAVAQNPDLFVLSVAEQYLGQWVVLVINVLLITSLFAASQSFHNTIARYFYVMARDGIFFRQLAKRHAVKGTPVIAGVCETISMGVFFLILVALGSDPMADIFAWGSILATMAILLLQVLVSWAVVAYFQTHSEIRQPRWKVLWCPLAASACMLATFITVLFNLHDVSGMQTNWVYLIPVVVIAAAVAGYVYAVLLGKWKPKTFQQLDELVNSAS